MKNLINKIKLKWLIPFLALILLLFFIPVFFSSKSESKNINNYKMQLVYDENAHTIEGKEEVLYVNNSENMFTHLYFHLYPNAFREGASAKVVSFANIEEAYPNGLSYGEINIKSVFSRDKPLNFEIAGEDENILIIELSEPIYPDDKTIIKIEFITSLANINHRLGYGNNTINIGNFYPIACVYEDGVGFSQSLYHSNGDPFYSDCSNYQIDFTCSENFTVASSGDLISTNIKSGNKEYKFEGKNMRDFCLVLSKNFATAHKNIEGVEVQYYGYKQDENLSQCLQVAIDALKTFNDMFGNYPYNQLSIVKSNFLHGGMEFPGIVLISDSIQQQEEYNYVIVHEIAHQWWFGVVGSDEYNHAWQDEGLAEYSTLLFFKKNVSYGENFKNMISSVNDSYALFEEVYTKVQGYVDGSMDRPLNKFLTEPEYVQCTYNKGVLLFNNVSDMIGEKKFISALKEYYKKFKFKNAMPEDLISVFVKAGGGKIEKLFDTWLEGKVIFK